MSGGNPYSAALVDRLAPGLVAVRAFVAHWDALESLVVDVYRAGRAGRAEEHAWRALSGWLTRHYPEHAAGLAVHWRPALGASAGDPFLALLALPGAERFVDNRSALELLPAAREALNRWLLALQPQDQAWQPAGTGE
jgi:hypothetical protein